MYVDPSKPLPVPTEPKKDYLGSVLEGLIKLHSVTINLNGDDATFAQKVTDVTSAVNGKLDKFASDVDAHLAAHVDKRGAVHGETKESVGLGNKDNWRTGTIAEHVTGTAQNLYAVPAGLKALVEARLTIDPKKYVSSRLIPVASGGQLGNVPQWPFDWREGEVIESFRDPLDYYTETPWQFRSDSGAFILPSMNGSDILTQAVADAGRAKRATTQWGGVNVRVFNKNIDVRRSRPSFLRGEGDQEPNNELVRGSTHLFDRHSVGYVDTGFIGARGYNRYRLPFDVITNAGKWNDNWKGILESHENFLYNIVTNIVKDNVGGFGDDFYLTIELNAYTFTENGIDVKNGPGNAAETTATIQDIFTAMNFSVPASGKIRIWKRDSKPDAICIKMRDIVTYTDAQMVDLVAVFDAHHSTHIAFTWRTRLKGDFAIRVPIGFYSKDRKYYTNYYMDLQFTCTENTTAKSVAVTVNTLRDITANIQTLNANLQVTTPGRWLEYPGTPAGDVFHPLVFKGIFESQGGHVNTYTLYNRQYIGYYQHNVTSVGDWLDDGDTVTPVMTKYQYSQISNLNNDGFYGDHLRHIPLGVGNGTTEYLTYSRDWRHQYRWAIAKVEQDTSPELLSPSGHHYGPWRLSTTWIEPNAGLVPSFVISNSENAVDFDNTCLVFNSQNAFKGYGRYAWDTSNADNPVQFLDPTSLDSSILAWVAQNGGGWTRNHRQFFYFKGILYWFSQTLDPAEIKTGGIDGYYGYIKNVYIDVVGDVRTVKVNGTIAENAVSTPISINTVDSLNINSQNVTGWDEFSHTDVYMMLMERNGNTSRYQVMVNLAPFNNFYYEFETVIDTGAGTVTFAPNSKATDPVFPYNSSTGFKTNYADVTGYPKLTPHQFHVNFQTPVMLKKSMWSFRKTPGNYGIFSQSIGTVIASGGLMNSVRGVPIYPVGCMINAGGSNVVAKSPVNASVETFDGNDELFVKLYESTAASAGVTSDGAVLYGRIHNPMGYETEPNSGIVPCGFLKNHIFYHYDPDGWRNDLLPVIDGKRMNFYGYGSSFPAFMGVYGSGVPVNRFFLVDNPTILSWNTATGRTVPISGGSNVKITINNTVQTYTGGGSFTIPSTYTGTIDIYITNMSVLKWGVGLTNIKQIGNTISSFDFTGSAAFTITAALPKNILSLKGVFMNATGASYSGLEKWDTSNVTDMSSMFQNAAAFNQDISAWDTSKVTTMERMFQSATAFNKTIGKWNTINVRSMKAMFLGATAFNGDISTWNVARVLTMSSMFDGASNFAANISSWNVGACSDFSRMFYNANSFNINIGAWNMGAATTTSMMFAANTGFNGNIANWDMSGVEDMSGMFLSATAFSRNLGNWNVGRCQLFVDMFNGTTNFGVANASDLSAWNVSSGTDFTRMFMGSNFNSKVDNWAPGDNALLTSMFEATNTFNQSIATWDVRNVLQTDRMFYGAKAFTTSMAGMDWESCVDFSAMFWNSVFNGSVKDWTFADVYGIKLWSMFFGDSLFTGVGVDTWDTSNVSDINGLFYGCTNFNVDVGNWDVSMVVRMRDLFRGTKFNYPLSKWDTSMANEMGAMFMNNSAFNQDISMWKTGAATNMDGTFQNATAFNQDLSGWDVSKVTSHVNFSTGATAWTKAKPSFPS